MTSCEAEYLQRVHQELATCEEGASLMASQILLVKRLIADRTITFEDEEILVPAP